MSQGSDFSATGLDPERDRPDSPIVALTDLTAHDLAFRARALAQAHALTEPASRYRSWRVGRDSPDHPFPELSTWAETAFLTGYCVRCVEESFVAEDHTSGREFPSAPSLPAWERDAATFVNDLPTDRACTLVTHALVLSALDDVIAREIDKRAEHVKGQVQAVQWGQFSDFIGWWTLHGYAIRATER